jgi:plasmid maintenance system antidote protein VapI
MPIKNTITDILRRAILNAINEGDASFKGLERATSVKRQSLMNFVRGKQSLRLDMADRIADHFGLVLKKGR